MCRPVLWMLGLLVLVPALAAQEISRDPAKAGKAPTVAEQVQALTAKQFQERLRIIKDFRKAKTNEEKDKLWKEYFGLAAKYSATCFAFAEKNPKDPGAIDALLWVVANDRSNGLKALDLLTEKFIKHKNLAGACLGLASSRMWDPEKFLRAALEENPHKEVQAASLFALGQRTIQGARGNEKVKAEGMAMLERVVKEFKDVSDLTKKLAQQAQTRLSLRIGGVAPEIEGEDIEGEKFKLSEYRGKVVVLDFWGHWCPPCRAMYPHARSLVKRLAGKPFALLGINSDGDREALKEVIKKENITWRSWWDGGSTSGPISTKWNVRGSPTIYILDAEGKIRYKYVRGEALDKAVETLLAELESKSKKSE